MCRYFDRVEATLQRTPLQATAVLRKKYEYLLKATKTALKRPWWDLQSYMYMAFGSSASAVTSAAGYPLLDVTMTGVRARFLSPPPIRIKQGIRSGNPDRERREEVEMQKVELPGIRVRRSRERICGIPTFCIPTSSASTPHRSRCAHHLGALQY